MGPVQSFKSVYDSNLEKRRKKKRERFDFSESLTSNETVPVISISEKEKLKIQQDCRKSEQNSRLRQALAALIIILIFTAVVLYLLNQ